MLTLSDLSKRYNSVEMKAKSQINLRSSSTVIGHSTRMNWTPLDTALIELSPRTYCQHGQVVPIARYSSE